MKKIVKPEQRFEQFLALRFESCDLKLLRSGGDCNRCEPRFKTCKLLGVCFFPRRLSCSEGCKGNIKPTLKTHTPQISGGEDFTPPNLGCMSEKNTVKQVLFEGSPPKCFGGEPSPPKFGGCGVGSREKTPTPKTSASVRKRPVLLRANFILTTDRKRPYYGHFCGKIHREGSCSKAARGSLVKSRC